MNIETLRQYCLAKPGVTEDFPFDQDTLVFRVARKMFLLTDIAAIPLSINVKCDPARALELRDRYEAVQPGYHMNKKHWNTVTLDGSIPVRDVREMIDHSYELIVSTLSKSVRDSLKKAGK